MISEHEVQYREEHMNAKPKQTPIGILSGSAEILDKTNKDDRE